MNISCLLFIWESNCNRPIQIALFSLSIPTMVKFAPRLLVFYLYLVLRWNRISQCVCMTVPAQTQELGSGGKRGLSLREMANMIQLAIDNATVDTLQ